MLSSVYLLSVLVAGQAPSVARTFCNPLPIPSVPLGREVVDGSWKGDGYREISDPTLLTEGKTLYLYPSAGMAWKSTDGAATWTKIDIGIEDVGYAPTVVKHRGRYLLMATDSDIYTSDSPEGPFHSLGPVEPSAPEVPKYFDPMLFSEDGRLYLYFGCTETNGIWGLELDGGNPRRIVRPARRLIAFEPDTQPWERLPNIPSVGWMEGSWMVKVGERYCLTYAASGTENETYATGAAWSDEPLGTFVMQKNNPIFRTVTGLVRGTSHGSIVPDPWVSGGYLKAYTVRVYRIHKFERLIGLDRIHLDANGDFAVSQASDVPQLADGTGAAPWRPMRLVAKSMSESLDNVIATASPLGSLPATVEFSSDKAAVPCAVRIIWCERGLRKCGLGCGPVRYRVEGLHNGTWTTLVDKSANDRDLVVDYCEFQRRIRTDHLRLVVLKAFGDIRIELAEFTVFAEGE